MTASDVLYEVRSNTGLGGFVLGREAADELGKALSDRPDVSSVEVTPQCDGSGVVWQPRSPRCMVRGSSPCDGCSACAKPSTAEVLAYLGHGEEL